MAMALVGGFLLAVIFRRGAGRRSRAAAPAGLVVTATAVLLAVLTAGYLVAWDFHGSKPTGTVAGGVAVVAVLAGAACAVLATRTAPTPLAAVSESTVLEPLLAVAVAAGAGMGVVTVLGLPGPAVGAVLGAGGGAAGLLGRKLADYHDPSSRGRTLGEVVFPLALGAPVAHLAGRVLMG
jgi:hypothetical protein